MNELLFDLNLYTKTPKSSFFDYNLDVEVSNSTPKVESKDSGLAISFGKTLPQLYGGKSVTRRTWTSEYAKKFTYAYWNTRRLKALDKDYRYGGKQIGWLRLTNEPYQESLLEMPAADVVAEGFPELSKEEFIEQFFDNNPDLVVWVIRFEFTPFDGYKGNEELLGNDQLPTTSGNDQLPTTSGNDQLSTTSGNDQLSTTDNLKLEVINLPTTDDLKLTAPTSNSPLPTTNSQEWLTLSEICRDGGTQSRAKLDLKHVATLIEVMEDGSELDPVTVFYDGESYWLADGFHRCKAHEDFGQEEINCTIIQGTRRDAVLFSVGANAFHKAVKPRSREDKRRAVLTLLYDPEWKEWSNVEIAKACKVSDEFVRRLRITLTSNVGSEEESTRTYTTKHGTKSRMRTGKIGRTPGETKEESGEEDNLLHPIPPPSPPPPIEEYLIGFISHVDEMSIPLLEEAQRHIDRRLKRSSDVNELNSKLNAIANERDVRFVGC